MAFLRVALAGAGTVASRYASCIAENSSLEFAGATDTIAEHAAAIVAVHGGTAYTSLDELLADSSVATVVNLTPPWAHAQVTRRCLEAGRHVHTEKPIALRGDEAWALAKLAVSNGVRLSCAPATLLGEGPQTAWKLIRDGAIGSVRVAYAEANYGRLETWHPSPEDLYAAGPLVDVGIYPITILTAAFGPVRRVSAYGTTIAPERARLDGVRFALSSPDFQIAVLEHEMGVVSRVTASFWVSPTKHRGIEFHGDAGSLWMPGTGFDSELERTSDGVTYEPIPLARPAYRGIDFARPLVDLADALIERRPHRMSAEHAAHVVDVLNASQESAACNRPVFVTTSFVRPVPCDWAQ